MGLQSVLKSKGSRRLAAARYPHANLVFARAFVQSIGRPVQFSHGFVGSITIDGATYQGNIPGGTSNPSAIRQVSTIDPVKGATNPSLNCGMNATEASDVANANPGSQLLVHWIGGSTGDSNWPHNVGPIMHYMTECSGSCSSFDSMNAEWFKISELGLETSDTWYQANLDVGEPVNVTIPSNIQPGNYLLRSEIISLQLAMSVGGAEFYPACIQLSIGGSGSGAPQSNEVCQFPGCYSDTEAGIYTPNIYNPPINYTFPGPPVAAFVNGSSDSGSKTDSPEVTTLPTPSAGSQTCKLVSPTGIVVKRGAKPKTHKRRPVRRWRY